VGRDVGGHTDGDAGGAVDEQIRHAGWKHRGLALGAIVIGNEVDSIFVEIGDELVRDARQTHLRITHGRRRIAVHRAEVALSIHQHGAHGEGLGHTHQGVVDRLLAVGMEFTRGVAADAGGFLERLVPVEPQLAHRIENTPMHRLQTVPDIR
jgi:hypothetical protein